MHKYLLLLVIIFLSLLNPVHAHRTKVFSWVDGTSISGEVYFAGGGPAKAAKVDLFANKSLLMSTQSNDMGEFSFAQLAPMDYEIVANAGQGHIASFNIMNSEFPVTVESKVRLKEIKANVKSLAVNGSCEDSYNRALINAIKPLRNQLDDYETKIRMHDVLGGVGYILGMFGLWALMRARKKC